MDTELLPASGIVTNPFCVRPYELSKMKWDHNMCGSLFFLFGASGDLFLRKGLPTCGAIGSKFPLFP